MGSLLAGKHHVGVRVEHALVSEAFFLSSNSNSTLELPDADLVWLSALWPAADQTLQAWTPFIEVTVALNIVASVYRHFAKLNTEWLEAYIDLRKKRLLLKCGIVGASLPGRFEAILNSHHDGGKGAIEWFHRISLFMSLLMASLGLLFLFLAGAHPEYKYSSGAQVAGAVLLVMPVPISGLLGFCYRGWVSCSVRIATRDLEITAWKKWLAARYARLSIYFDNKSVSMQRETEGFLNSETSGPQTARAAAAANATTVQAGAQPATVDRPPQMNAGEHI